MKRIPFWTALIALLTEVQQICGSIPRGEVTAIADIKMGTE